MVKGQPMNAVGQIKLQAQGGKGESEFIVLLRNVQRSSLSMWQKVSAFPNYFYCFLEAHRAWTQQHGRPQGRVQVVQKIDTAEQSKIIVFIMNIFSKSHLF